MKLKLLILLAATWNNLVALWHQLTGSLTLANSTGLVGRACLHGAGGSITWASVAVNTDRELQGIDLTDEADVQELKNRLGATIGLAAVDPKRRVTFDFIPTGGSGANNTLAQAKAAAKFCALLEVITIDDLGLDDLDGDWQYIGGGRMSITNNGYVKLSLPCAQYDGATFDAVT
jgi:hypothetical protein